MTIQVIERRVEEWSGASRQMGNSRRARGLLGREAAARGFEGSPGALNGQEARVVQEAFAINANVIAYYI